MTIEKAIAGVREVAGENPDFVYEPPIPIDDSRQKCSYFGDAARPGAGQDCGCLIGQGFHRAGIIIPRELDGYRVMMIISGFKSTEQQYEWLKAAQEQQDVGFPWNHCVKYADKVSPLP